MNYIFIIETKIIQVVNILILMKRIDYGRLKLITSVINDTYDSYYAYFNPVEDYGADFPIYNEKTGNEVLMEAKTISSSYGSITDNSYWSTKSARGDKWRWCTSASTQEEFWADETPSPDFGDKPLQMLNAADKYGRKENAKLTKLLRDGCGLVYLAEDGLLLFSPKQLKDAIVGYGWVYLAHTKELNDTSKKFEYKALIDMSKGKFIPVNNVPKELLDNAKQ